MYFLQAVGEVLNGGVQRAQSCTLQQPVAHPHQPRDTHGYLEPVCTPKGRPRYLELIGDDEAIGGPTTAGVEGTRGGNDANDNNQSSSLRPPVSQSNKQLAASAPSLVSKLVNAPSGKPSPSHVINGPLPNVSSPIMYAELDAESLEANLDKAHKALYQDKLRTGDVGYWPRSLPNGYPATSNSHTKGASSHNGSYEPFLQPPCASNSFIDEGTDLDPASDSEHENRRLLGGRERRKSSSPFLRDLSPFIDKRRGTSPLLRDLSPFHCSRGNGGDRHHNPSVRYDELNGNNHVNDGYLKPRNHENDGYLKPRDSAVMGRPPIANGNLRHYSNRQPSVYKI